VESWSSFYRVRVTWPTADSGVSTTRRKSAPRFWPLPNFSPAPFPRSLSVKAGKQALKRVGITAFIGGINRAKFILAARPGHDAVGVAPHHARSQEFLAVKMSRMPEDKAEHTHAILFRGLPLSRKP